MLSVAFAVHLLSREPVALRTVICTGILSFDNSVLHSLIPPTALKNNMGDPEEGTPWKWV